MGEPAPRTVLVIHPGSLGDVLLSLPALRALRTAFPDHHRILMAGAEVSGLLKDSGEVDRVFALERRALADVFAGPDAVGHRLLALLGRCDLAVCWSRDTDGLRTALEDLGVRRVIVRSPHSIQYDGLHQADRFVETVREVTGVRGDGTALHLPGRALADARRYLNTNGVPIGQPLVVLHPGSGSRHKCCAPDLFVALIARLHLCGAFPVVVGGPADADMIERVVRNCAAAPPVLDEMELGLAAGVIAQADLFLGHDSGLTHLAAAMGVQTVALFGPTEVSRWGPRGNHVQCLWGAACRCGDWNAVRSCPDRPCLRIPVGRVMDACEVALDRRERDSPRAGLDRSACSV